MATRRSTKAVVGGVLLAAVCGAAAALSEAATEILLMPLGWLAVLLIAWGLWMRTLGE
ncbi:MAG: hypothetical protein ACYTED_20620 [Planctomycetota bacterium]|jgi:hypothetical protein